LQPGNLGIDLGNDILYIHEPSGIEDNSPDELQGTLGLNTQAKDCSPQLVYASWLSVISHVLDQISPCSTTKNISRAGRFWVAIASSTNRSRHQQVGISIAVQQDECGCLVSPDRAQFGVLNRKRIKAHDQ
jgi:hypothetical protein